MTTITFNNEDMQLDSHLLNRSLYISDYIQESKINHMIIDCGEYNPYQEMKRIGIDVGDLSTSKIMIQIFN